MEGEDVIWLNGDVVCETEVLSRVATSPGTCMAVNRADVGHEEVKYRVSDQGMISEVSKQVQDAIGEALGVNKVAHADVRTLVQCLEAVGDTDYFEHAIQRAIDSGMDVRPVDVSDLFCVEVDFREDLERANQWLTSQGESADSGPP
jgi:choline kinase